MIDIRSILGAVAKEFVASGENADAFAEFLSQHIQLKARNAEVFEQYAEVVYHQNVAVSARARREAYQKMLNMLRLDA